MPKTLNFQADGVDFVKATKIGIDMIKCKLANIPMSVKCKVTPYQLDAMGSVLKDDNGSPVQDEPVDNFKFTIVLDCTLEESLATDWVVKAQSRLRPMGRLQLVAQNGNLEFKASDLMGRTILPPKAQISKLAGQMDADELAETIKALEEKQRQLAAKK